METPHTTDTTTPETPATPEVPVTSPETPVVPTPEVPAKPEIKLSELADVSKTYPKALEFAGEIETRARERGLSVTDAALLVLHENNALTPPVAAPTGDRMAGMGGSMDNPPPRQEGQDPVPGAPGSIEFYADRFRKLEADGEIRLA